MGAVVCYFLQLKRGASVSDLFEKEEKEEDFNEIVDQDDERVEEVVSQVGSLCHPRIS